MVITFAQYSLLSSLSDHANANYVAEKLDFNTVLIHQLVAELMMLELIEPNHSSGSYCLTSEGIRSLLDYERDNPTLKR
ncbi:hypothetical protein GCM10028806_42240 [Spirosoma terrae]|uniref:ArnR1-like winged helix-turn-helix domain-containing protein n=1 Tax=Spirosoma terrae TaxID=1968276 RepID=A0A6L9L1A6_9BACT|nr:hypothetical protein [Spirosoma terrae]NDU94110.1 hypothetical protein [Spirosoma terrae]